MAMLEEGIWPCLVLSADAVDVDGVIKARVNVKIEDGPSKGRFCTYEDEVNARSSLYVSRSLRAIGWQGKTLQSVKDDCAAWIAATGGRNTVEIKHVQIRNGKRAGEIWDKPNSIGRGPKPGKPPTGEALTDADDAMRRAMAEDGSAMAEDGSAMAEDGSASPSDDVPHPAAGSGDDIPFISCSASISLGEIAKVLR